MKRAITIGVAAALTVVSAAAPAAANGYDDWIVPSCGTVTGDGTVTYTRTEGKTITPTSKRLSPVVYTTGLVALDRPDTLLSIANNRLSRSTDAGCTWRPLGQVNGSHVELVAAPGGSAYAWDREGNLSLTTAESRITPLTSPAPEVAGLGTDRNQAGRLRVADGDGQLHESADGGRTWQPVGVPAWPQSELLMVYTAVFDPADLDHVVLGSAGDARVTFDGGRTWSTATGMSEGGKVNVFSAAISAVAPNVVWAMGLNLKELDAGVPSGGRHIYMSSDGGRSFTPVVDHGAEITISNGPLLTTHPANPGVLYFEFGTGWAGTGTDLYRYDARANKVTTNHNNYDRVTSITFNPASPQLMYLGVAEES
ncbi:sialidase family protein [Nonomuraea sp. NPDC050643]|uniref:WD40/YVTN/BNR-like repeat-containing protein n=1 Tax=Nonomuraea sp. NPDC050643 TaxID=3155660 RepID=UPI003402DE77